MSSNIFLIFIIPIIFGVPADSFFSIFLSYSTVVEDAFFTHPPPVQYGLDLLNRQLFAISIPGVDTPPINLWGEKKKAS